MSGAVYPLEGAQKSAVNPQDSVWLSASAGTGKTQVLSARVLRLLLQADVQPSQILCLTFTKAGAAEMAVRINEVLARWVRLPDGDLAAELLAIGAEVTPEIRARARSLFASVLDCPGGGLRIDTIHAFAQWLLAAFPEEAGLLPGTRAMEDRERDLLAHDVLVAMLTDAEQAGDWDLIEQLAMLSRRMGPDGAQNWLMRCAKAREIWFGPGAWTPPLRPRLEPVLGLPREADENSLAELCGDDKFDCASLRQCLAAQHEWGTKTAAASAAAIESWLAASAQDRVVLSSDLRKALFTQKDEPRSLKSLLKHDPAYEAGALRVLDGLDAIAERQRLLDLIEWLEPALAVGRQFALRWDEAKAREGLIDFDDQIRRAADLLRKSGLAEWIRYKLDRRFDHILIDEAQDTNEAQWAIVDALTDDFFAGMGARDGKLRTVFVVGDYKQAIFRFQGTSPENFEAARRRFRARISEAAHNAEDLRDPAISMSELRELGLDRSFRTAQTVLDFVDEAIAAIGGERFGLSAKPEPHEGQARPGQVVLWRAIGGADDQAPDGDGGEESWLSGADRMLADKIARQVHEWLDKGFTLVKGHERRAKAGDVMILLRKRRDLAGLIVARLHARGVPVAGVDRLRLGAPLAVRDLMAAIRFAAQPLDDLNLANLLVSPLIGWSQDDLLAHAPRLKNRRLWAHLRQSEDAMVRTTLETLGQLLARADYESPQAMLHWILTGPWQGRKALFSRLGMEAQDAIDELLNAAQAYASAHVPSLQGFIQWFDMGDGELKRQADSGEGLVRVMTVHGSKGLQAPIVILADAAGKPGADGGDLTLPDQEFEGLEEILQGRRLPIPRLRKSAMAGQLVEEAKKAAEADMAEHWRLLYVAMTRAEEALFIGGSLGLRENEPDPDSWYARLAPLFPEDSHESEIWGESWHRDEALPIVPKQADGAAEQSADVPLWARSPVGPEPRPPRPLAPSALGEEAGADPPLLPEQVKIAARRGVLLHRLLERLPDIAADRREQAGRTWLARNAADIDETERGNMLASALTILAEPGWAELFSPQSLAEVPFAATVDGQVIAGTVDRLLVEPERILVADFKTSRRPPQRVEEIPEAALRQMAAYVAALGMIYPDRRIEAALLYTQKPQIFVLPDALLARYKPGFASVQESFDL
ncbi:double-strand break repair helicase AddA [Altericroceibacterium endophyticum]|uniref:DNA 3'-5' helicase n=1 Tax=Altericroceibacterium endophyticum TaxID=1808508 RepID=A0A6I4T438_9SPHN|nr:double-strand break repair helicase AddA [Altericroceibacterium endophyticum]MXO64730.1 double-strand break repair helicase AddA [Altericroceibacterium endophyticum]